MLRTGLRSTVYWIYRIWFVLEVVWWKHLRLETIIQLGCNVVPCQTLVPQHINKFPITNATISFRLIWALQTVVPLLLVSRSLGRAESGLVSSEPCPALEKPSPRDLPVFHSLWTLENEMEAILLKKVDILMNYYYYYFRYALISRPMELWKIACISSLCSIGRFHLFYNFRVLRNVKYIRVYFLWGVWSE